MRKFLFDWLLSSDSLRAWIQLALAIPVAVCCVHFAGHQTLPWMTLHLSLLILLGLLIAGPVWYYCLPPLFFGLMWLMIRFGKGAADYPCPVCGYDIRATPHRCPECGTSLRWGQLPD